MKFRYTLLILALLSATKSFSQSPSKNSIAKTLVEKAISAMGDGWKSVQTLSLDGYGYKNDIDQSERPEGPYIPGQYTRSIQKDLSKRIFRVDQKEQDYDFGSQPTYLFNEGATAMKAGTKIAPTLQAQQLYDDLYLAPELILQKALVSPDLTFVKDTIYQKAKHSIVAFSFEGWPVRIFLNQETSLITAVEITKPYQNEFFSIWGDSRKITEYSFWMLLGKGIHYPLQQDTYINGYYRGAFLVNKWQVNPQLNADSLMIPAEVKEQGKLMAKKQQDGLSKQIAQGGKEIAPGIWFLRGPCNSTIIEQPDGIVVIESPLASYYGEALISRAKALFPSKKIKALITTSDAWLHIGGARAFAAIPGIKIYHPARNTFILNKLLKANYKTEPDAFAKTAKPGYALTDVSDSMAVGTGKNRLVIYAYKTETGDRQMMVYFPEHQLLYTSDLYQPKDAAGKFWNPQIVWEVYHSIQQRKLDVKQFYAMHSAGVMPFEDFTNDVKNGME